MKTLSFSRTALAILVTAAAYAFAAPAQAQYSSYCDGCTNTTPAPANFSFQLGGAFGGTSEALASGNGPTRTSSVGGLNLEALISGSTNGCEGGCGNSTTNFSGQVFQRNIAEAMSQNAGSSSAATLSSGAVRLTFGR
jgi:hypothetical protein